MKISKIGLTLTAIYIPITIGLWIYAETCSAMLCGLEIIIPLSPWIILLEDIDGINNLYDNNTLKFLIVLIIMTINSFILYGFGWMLSLFVRKIKNR